jgi:acetyl-CoA synthetase
MLPLNVGYDDLYRNFRWNIPEFYNIGIDVCDKWALVKPTADALFYLDSAGAQMSVTFAELRDLSNKLANVLRHAGVGRGDRVGILLPQAPETAYAHIAIYKLGAIAVPLFTLFGPDALEYRLSDAGVIALITNNEGVNKLQGFSHKLPQLTGMPKGALHAHRVLLGHLPGVEISHEFFPRPNDRIWTPADWAWIGGLLDVLLPALHHGVPIVAHRLLKFSGEAAFEIMRKFDVRNAFLPPTALKLMRTASSKDAALKMSLRSVASGGEPLGSELLQWGRDVFGVTINEFYGQTECNMTVSSCNSLMPSRRNRLGRPVPGHDVRIVDADGNICPAGVAGSIAVRRNDPVMFLKYWNNPAATSAKFRGDWLITGDVGVCDEEGWLQFVGRDDDIITSAGYRIGPSEIEDCLLQHSAVQMAGVVGKPDPVRTEIVKAYIVLKSGVQSSDELASDIRQFVKHRLAAHEYPREIDFVDELPLTVTGKVIRNLLRNRAAGELQGTTQ